MAQCNGQWNAITYGFKVGAPLAIDDRLVLTKEQMLKLEDDRMPNTYFAVCSDDGKFYLYNKNNSKDIETGRFRLYVEDQKVLDVRNSIEDRSYVVDGVAMIDIPLKVDNNHRLCMIYDDSI